MAEVVHDAQQEFWRPPIVREGATEVLLAPAAPILAEACPRCHSEFMIGARFCHTCGAHRPEKNSARTATKVSAREFLSRGLVSIQTAGVAIYKQGVKFPSWLRYLHFHEIKACIGLPTASFVAFLIGLGCVMGALGVSLFYRASNLAEFQAIQMWRIEWLLAATASFVAGILLKKPSGNDPH